MTQAKMLKCPRCKETMEVALKEKVEVDHCKKCEGVWVEHCDEKEVLEIKPEVFTMDELKRLRELYEPLGKREKVQYIPCPVCEHLMQRRNWGSHSGVIVDKCRQHGTWYDAGEVEKIQEFIAVGGIEFEKVRAAKKDAKRVEQKLTREVHRLDMKAESIYRRARFWSIIGF